MTIEARLAELAITLPAPPKPVGAYVGAVATGNLVFIAGHGPRRPDGSHMSREGPDGARASRRRSRPHAYAG